MDQKTALDAGLPNSLIFEEQYEKYSLDPESVDPSWREFFRKLKKPTPSTPKEVEQSIVYQQLKPEGRPIFDNRIVSLIQAYRTEGHQIAHINPLEEHAPKEPSELKLETHGFNKQDLAISFPTFGILPEKEAPLLKIVNTLKAIYCNQVGVEYMDTHNYELESWLQRKIEPTLFKPQLNVEQKQMIFQQLNKSAILESFLHTKYVGQKRFSLEGAESLIPMLSFAIDTGAKGGIEEFVIGMAHRGRLNVLTNIMNKSYAEVFSEFDENYGTEMEGSGDVKYHKGYLSDVETLSGKKVKIDLSPNPSHLESVDPVVEGMVRAKQDHLGEEKVFPILIHGDAALAGQGVVYETMQLYNLKGYKTGGTLHIVINNQIGFTTIPEDARSTRYCTDLAKTFDVPVFHVNVENPEECVYATILAMEIRLRYHMDVFIDLVCYRKYGHNESDEPAFTQPLEYQIIRKKKSVRDLYRDRLIAQGVVEKYLAESLETEFKKALNQALKNIKLREPVKEQKKEIKPSIRHATSVPINELEDLAEVFTRIPEDFSIHPKLGTLVKEHLEIVKEKKPIDWGLAETFAYATLLMNQFSVRISGQDSCRGTFSHRHAIWVDQVQEKNYFPLQHLSPNQGNFEIYNSPLSEFAVLGFDYGYSVDNGKTLVIWEAQFGDFSNGGQVIIDQYIATSEQKWGTRSGIVLLLPHGYEGQGPEHSSARVERYLSLCGHDNMQIVNPTTPAQFFHLLRNQMLNQVLKPLIIFTPKGLLRHPDCVSTLNDLAQGSFQEIVDDPTHPNEVKRIVLCTGRIYYDIAAMRTKLKVKDLALIRIEQLYPLNVESLRKIVEGYNGFKECFWIQEEPSNMGAWEYLRPLFREVLPKGKEVKFIGRPRSAATAVGSHAIHKKEMSALLDALFKQEIRVMQDEIDIKS